MSDTDPDTNQPSSGFIFSNKLYGKTKFTALVLLPALQTLYFTLGAVWDLPNVEQVIGTIAAVDTFLGVLLGLSTKAYNSSEARYDGHIAIEETSTGGKLYSLELKGDPEDIDQKKTVTFKVGSPLPPPQLR